MTTEVLTYVIGAGQTVRAPRGRLFFVKSAPNGGLTITAAGRPGSPLKFANISAGLKYGPVDESEVWQYLEITSATAQTVEMIIGDDDVEVAGTVSIAGTVATFETVIAAIGTTADISASAGAQTLLLGFVAARRNMTISNISTNPGSVRIGDINVSATRGVELQPGMNLQISTNAAVYCWNPNASACSIGILAEQ